MIDEMCDEMRDIIIAYIQIYVCVCVLNDDVYGMYMCYDRCSSGGPAPG